MYSRPNILSLPSELTIAVVQHLEDDDLLCLRLVCTQLKDLIDGPAVNSWYQMRVLSGLGDGAGRMQFKSTTAELLTGVAIARSTCKWLATAVSSYLATCLPPELHLADTNFHKRVETTLAGDMLETQFFLETFRKLQPKRINQSEKRDGTWTLVETARKALSLTSLGTVSKMVFLLADMLHETVQHASNVRSQRKIPGTELSISSDVFIWLLFHAGLRQVNHLMCDVDSGSRITFLRDMLGDQGAIVEQSAYYRQPVARARLHLRQPEQTQNLIRLLQWQRPEHLRANEPLYQRIFRSLRK